MLFLILALLSQEPVILNPGSEIFEFPIAAVDENGFYVLDPHEKRLLIHLNQNEKTKIVSGPGQGPGRLNRPSSFSCVDGQLIIRDWGKIKIFSTDGAFVKQIQRPTGIMPEKTMFGWIGLRGVFDPHRSNETRLIGWNDDFGEEKEWFRWESENSRNPESQKTDVFNPVAQMSHLEVDNQNHRAYVFLVGIDAIFVFDTKTGKPQRAIEIPGPSLPFDHDWGLKSIEDMKKVMGPVFANLKPHFPEFFPRIINFDVTAKGFLALYKWGYKNGAPNTGEVLLFDPQGNPQEAGDLDKANHIHRIVHIEDNFYYVHGYEPASETYVVVKVQADQVLRYLEENPLPEKTMNDLKGLAQRLRF